MLRICEHGELLRRAILLHINGRRPDIQRPRRQQLIEKIAVDLRTHIVDVGLEDTALAEHCPRALA